MTLWKKLPGILILGICLTLIPATSPAQCGDVADPGFENPPLGDFGSVVDPTFSGGYWGDENSSIVVSGACAGVSPFTGSSMLEMEPTGGNNTEVWQAVPVGPNPVGSVSVSAYFTACEGLTPTAVVQVRTFNSDTGWPTSTTNTTASLVLDDKAATWEKVTLDCVEIPNDTLWILIDLNFVVAGLGGQKGYVDEVGMICGCDPVPIQKMSWSNVKALYD